jgi:glucuronokinase
MRHLASLVDSARDCLQTNNKQALAVLMDENFSTRRKLYSDAVVGLKNVHVARLLNEKGLAAKFTGSGGAFVCLNRSGEGWCVRVFCIDNFL